MSSDKRGASSPGGGQIANEPNAPSKSCDAHRNQADVEAVVLEYIRSLRFGSVEITVHNARIVQVERREKLRVGQSVP
jgi:hypothetical protein